MSIHLNASIDWSVKEILYHKMYIWEGDLYLGMPKIAMIESEEKPPML